MARIQIILEDEAGTPMVGTEPRIYELGAELQNLHHIEGQIERCRRQTLPELTAELLSQAQAE